MATGATDKRLGFNGLYGLVCNRLPLANSTHNALRLFVAEDEPSTKVVSRRFVKKQQMQWTLRGAHLQAVVPEIQA